MLHNSFSEYNSVYEIVSKNTVEPKGHKSQ